MYVPVISQMFPDSLDVNPLVANVSDRSPDTLKQDCFLMPGWTHIKRF